MSSTFSEYFRNFHLLDYLILFVYTFGCSFRFYDALKLFEYHQFPNIKLAYWIILEIDFFIRLFGIWEKKLSEIFSFIFGANFLIHGSMENYTYRNRWEESFFYCYSGLSAAVKRGRKKHRTEELMMMIIK